MVFLYEGSSNGPPGKSMIFTDPLTFDCLRPSCTNLVLLETKTYLVMVLVLSLFGIEASQILEVVFEVDLDLRLFTLRLGV